MKHRKAKNVEANWVRMTRARQQALRKLRRLRIDASTQVGYHVQQGIQENA